MLFRNLYDPFGNIALFDLVSLLRLIQWRV